MFMGWNFSKKKVYSLPIFQWAGSTRKEKFPMGYYCRMDLAVVGDRVLGPVLFSLGLILQLSSLRSRKELALMIG
jgi:hypothetical protein